MNDAGLPQLKTAATAEPWRAVGISRAHESAILHVRGEATYTDDIAEVAGTLHGALGLSSKAHARIVSVNLDKVRAAAGVAGVFAVGEIPGLNDCGPIIHDDPIFADGVVLYVGQPIFIVVASTHDQARRAARLADIVYEELPAILTPQGAKAAGSFVLPPMRLARGDYQAAFEAAPHAVKGELYVGGQEQFYLEGQIAYAIPKEDQGMLVQCSTQHPSEMQHVVAHALGLASHNIVVECRRMGGGFGGKESQSALWCAAAAIAAAKLKRPVKLRADRDDDMLVTGKRHCFHYEYAVGYDDTGRILAARVDMVTRAGYSADLSGPVATRAVCHFDNTYYLSDVDIRAACGKTNTQSNTAFRGFGGPQGAIAIEYVIDEIARNLQRDPLDIRRLNFYGAKDRNVTPYGQPVVDNVIGKLVDQLEASSSYRARRAAIEAYNAASPVLKKGLALTPVKFGIAFNVTHLNQAGALVHVYTDGSIHLNHGGTEMGQGLNIKVAQVVAHEFQVPLETVKISATRTDKVPNTSATAASSGSDLNGMAAQAACRTLKERLTAFAAREFGCAASAVVFGP
ncbi:MAG: xanthine dehydrogenase molybdopterin binding subunit, partial [Massilia sp.]